MRNPYLFYLIAAASTAISAAPAAQAANPSPLYCAVNVATPTAMICGDSPTALLTATSASSAIASSVLIARLYDNANYDGSAGYLEVYAAADCTASKSNIDSSLADLGAYDNRISSFKSFGNCATRLWTATSFTGSAYPSSTTLTANSTNVGTSTNDKARSAQFS